MCQRYEVCVDSTERQALHLEVKCVDDAESQRVGICVGRKALPFEVDDGHCGSHAVVGVTSGVGVHSRGGKLDNPSVRESVEDLWNVAIHFSLEKVGVREPHYIYVIFEDVVYDSV